jgi:hypothetical protein
MCLDPRPDSLLRTHRAAARVSPAVSAARLPRSSTDTRSAARTPAEGRESWLPVFADDLDARGWTLVSRAVATC